MNTEIGQLQLQLPPGFEKRAQRIGRLVGENLAHYTALPSGRIEHLQVGPVRIERHFSDSRVARQIAESIYSALHGQSFHP